MNCNSISENLWAYVEGSLSPDLSSEFAAHLDTCDNCRKKTGELKRFEAIIEGSSHTEPNQYVVTRILSRIESELEKREKAGSIIPGWVLRPAMVFLGIFLGVLIGFYGAYNRAKQTYKPAKNDMLIESLKTELFLTDIMDEQKSLTSNP